MTAYASRPLVLASAGIGMVGASFGMARYGVGLLAPDIRRSFHLDNGSLGLLAAASYIAYLATSVSAGALAVRLGPRSVVAAGGLCAVVGMVIAAAAATPAALFAGLLVAGASAGLVFPPFSDVVAGCLAGERRARVLAAISSGTGWGVALAAPIAVLAGDSWRSAWLAFALIAAAATMWAITVLPGRDAVTAPGEIVRLRLRWFLCPRSSPLLTGALLVGLGSSVYWTFGVEQLAGTADPSEIQGPVFLAIVGLASVGGTAGGDAAHRLGGRAVFTLAAVAEASALLLLGLAPGAAAAVVVSAILFGAAYNTVVAVQVIWSSRVFASRPSAGLAAVMVMNAVGLLFGPPTLGALADRTGLATIFVAAAGLLVVTPLAAPRETVR